MRLWANNTGRAALVTAGAVAIATAFGPGAVADTTAGNFSVAGGNQVHAPISIPVEASGNAISVLGLAQAQSKGGSSVKNARHGGDGMHTSGNFSIGGGNQVYAPISIPIDVCGNAVAVLGLSRAQCKGGASVSSHREGGGWEESGHRAASTGAERHDGGGMQTAGNFSILGGNQVYTPISIPINVCGNAVAVLGLAQARCKGGASVHRGGDHPKMKTSGNFSVLGGNQVHAPISIPIDVCGNAVAILGLAEAQCKGGASVGKGGEEKLPPTLRTPKKKPYKPSKHRPAAGHKKLPSTMRADNSRMARPAAATASEHRKADTLGGVRGVLNSLKRPAKVAGVDVKPGQIGPKLPSDGQAPVKIGSPVLK